MWQVQGQDHILKQLEQSLRLGQMAHAYLLVGPPQVGKMTLALNLAQSVNCVQNWTSSALLEGNLPVLAFENGGNHGVFNDSSIAAPSEKDKSSVALPFAEVGQGGFPCGSCVQCTRIVQGRHADVRIVGVGRGKDKEPTSTVIGIEDVKVVMHHANLKPYEGSCGVIIFDGAEFMSEQAANALLKTLEEPPPQVMILLLTANEEALLPTIKSRCQRLMLRPVPRQQIVNELVSAGRTGPQEAERLSRLSRGCLGWVFTALEDPTVLAQRKADLERLQEVMEGGLEGRFTYAADLAALFFKDRESTRQLLYLWLRCWRDLLLIKEGADQYVQDLEGLAQLRLQATRLTTAQIVGFMKRLHQTLEDLDSNANSRLALEVLMLHLPSRFQ